MVSLKLDSQGFWFLRVKLDSPLNSSNEIGSLKTIRFAMSNGKILTVTIILRCH